MKQRGISLIEVMIGIAFAMIIIAVGLTAFGTATGNGKVSVGINGVLETRCIEGYKFIISQDSTRQILDEFGKGVRCENPNAGKPGAFGKM
jgi:hypothetical protein